MAEFKQNEIYFGFRLQKIEEINDIHSTAYLFSHEKSGARLLYLKNADHNKVFNVVFKTPPENDCGTPHILNIPCFAVRESMRRRTLLMNWRRGL